MVQNFEFHNFWGSQKNEYVLGYKDFTDIFFFFWGGGVIIKLDYTYGSFLCIYAEWMIFLGVAKISNIF